MKRFLVSSAVMAAAMMWCGTSFAQSGQVGLGVSVGNSVIDHVNLATNPSLGNDSLFGHATLLVPLNLIPNLRIEPFLGFSTLSVTNERSAQNVDLTTESTTSALSLGAGVFYTYAPLANMGVYAGGRLGLVRLGSDRSVETVIPGGKRTDETSVSRLDGVISLVVGGEVYLASYFSVGVEGAINIGIVGDEEIDPKPTNTDDDNDPETSIVAIGTGSALVARFYFN